MRCTAVYSILALLFLWLKMEHTVPAELLQNERFKSVAPLFAKLTHDEVLSLDEDDLASLQRSLPPQDQLLFRVFLKSKLLPWAHEVSRASDDRLTVDDVPDSLYEPRSAFASECRLARTKMTT